MTYLKDSVTIDSDSSIDLDDAFWLTANDDGSYLLEVFIANPSAYFSVGDSFYNDALEKVATRYHAKGIRESMLDMELTKSTLSLLEGLPKDSIRFEISVAPDGSSKLLSVSKCQVNNICRLNHSLVNKDGKHKSQAVQDMLSAATKCGWTLFNRRLGSGAVAFADAESGLMANEDGALIEVDMAGFDGHLIIQEFMIATNTLFAEYSRDNELPVIYRNHSAPKAIGDKKDFIQHVLDTYSCSEPSSNLVASMLPRARYNSFNRGHFALDLPNYSTVTSPIRRFVDLHNILVLTNYLDGINSKPIDESVCAGINERLDKQKEEVSNSFKAVAERKALFKFNSYRRGKGLTATELKFVLKSKPTGSRANKLARLMARFLEDNKSTELVRALWYIGLDADEDAVIDLTTRVIAVKGLVVAAMREMISKGYASWEYEPAGVKLSMLGHQIAFDKRGTEKAAFEKATKLLVLKMYGLSESLVEIEDPSSTGTKEDFVNWKGQLLDLCSKARLPKPKFDVSKKGAAHDMSFKCSVTVTLKEGYLSASGTAKQIKKAEQAASEIVFKKLESKVKEAGHLKGNSKTASKKLPPTGDPKSAICMFTQKNKLEMPVFKSDVSGSDHAPVFDSICSITMNNQVLQGSGQGASKKASEKAAASALLTKLDEMALTPA